MNNKMKAKKHHQSSSIGRHKHSHAEIAHHHPEKDEQLEMGYLSSLNPTLQWSNTQKLGVFFCAMVLVSGLEVGFGQSGNSCALLADGIHMILDSTAIGIGFVAALCTDIFAKRATGSQQKTRPKQVRKNNKRTILSFFGLDAMGAAVRGMIVRWLQALKKSQRSMEYIGGAANATLLLVLGVQIGYIGALRLLNPAGNVSVGYITSHFHLHHHHDAFKINSSSTTTFSSSNSAMASTHHHSHEHQDDDGHSHGTAVVAAVGLLINVIGVIFFHQPHGVDHAPSSSSSSPHSHSCSRTSCTCHPEGSDMNMMGVYLHLMCDLLGSVMALGSSVASLYLTTPNGNILDGCCAILLGVIMTAAGARVFYDIGVNMWYRK